MATTLSMPLTSFVVCSSCVANFIHILTAVFFSVMSVCAQSKLVLVRLDVLETFNDRYEEFR